MNDTIMTAIAQWIRSKVTLPDQGGPITIDVTVTYRHNTRQSTTFRVGEIRSWDDALCHNTSAARHHGNGRVTL